MKHLVNLAIFLLISNPVYSACLETNSKDIEVKFMGYKTPLKIGVSGIFTSVTLANKAKGDSWKKITLDNKLTIDTSKIDSGDKSRDIKLAKFFFENKKIEATITNISEKKKQLTMNITMNGKTVNKVKMNYSYNSDMLKAEGYVDALDFAMNKQLKSLNRACLAKHEGKTWSDVKIELKAKFGKCRS